MEPKYNLNNLRQLIKEYGHVSISTFMENVIAHYYRNAHSIGTDGDFITAPEISQIFGEMIGIWCVINWQNLGSPSKISLIELGPGRGTLMNDILRATKHVKGFHDALEIVLIETSPKLHEMQKEKLSSWKKIKFSFAENLSKLEPQASLFIANEFFDALPIYQYLKIKQYWYENIVTTLTFDGEFCISNLPAPINIDNFLNYEFPHAGHRAVVETSPASIDIIKKISHHISKYEGYALIIDYGYDYKPDERLYFNSSLQAVKNHSYQPLLSDIGHADVTSHVDFFALKQAALDSGCNIFGSVSQRDFLTNLGIGARLEILTKNSSPEEERILRKGVERLISPELMGNLFKVLSISSQKMENNIGFTRVLEY